jgi:hypothetical protein
MKANTLAVLVLSLSLVGCVTTGGSVKKKDPEQKEAPKQFVSKNYLVRLGQQFEPMKKKDAVLADRLEVTMSASLWDQVTHPAGSNYHQIKRLQKRGSLDSEYRFLNLRGGTNIPLKFQIGHVTLLILQTAVFHVRGGGEPIFRLKADGKVAYSTKGKTEQGLKGLVVEDGKVRLIRE